MEPKPVELDIWRCFTDSMYFTKKYVEFETQMLLFGQCIITWEGGQDKITKEDIEK